MEEEELRRLGEELRAELPTLIPDRQDRKPVETALEQALAAPSGATSAALDAVLESHARTREWLRARLPTDTQRMVGVAGDTTSPLGAYFVCPNNDPYDFVRETLATPVPVCPFCKSALVQADG